tara:strand:- start:664 stop:903 length:240 start_codon:yes stop_codon:yes gene_type:complete
MTEYTEEGRLELKIFVTMTLLQELLDETEGRTNYKDKVKRKISQLGQCLQESLDVEIDTDELSLYLSNATQALDNSLKF